MKVCFETFGCRLNKAEALQMEADYLARGWERTESHANADLFVIRGCSVTAHAQSECEKLIAHLKRKYPLAQFRICGCIDKKTLKVPGLESPNVRVPRFPNRQPLKPSSLQTLKSSNPQTVPTRTARAYLKVQDGCAGNCTFCIVPKFRGTSKSEDHTSLLDKAKRFIEAGYHEIVVTGCNLSLYASQGKRLPNLLAALAGLDADCRIRLGSIEPGSCALETVQAMAEHSNVCRFLHLTAQSGSEKILRTMRRPYSVRDIDLVAATAAKLMPRIGLGCDLMTGFPGETELDHLASKGLLTRLPFNNAHVFPFSERPGTPAAAFHDSVPKDVRSARAHDLSELIRTKRRTFAKTFIGQTVEIIVEDGKTGRGWSGEYLPCEPVTGTHTRKSRIRLIVTKAEGDVLYGRPAK